MNPRDSEKSPALRRIEAGVDNPSEAVLFVSLKTVFHKKLKYRGNFKIKNVSD